MDRVTTLWEGTGPDDDLALQVPSARGAAILCGADVGSIRAGEVRLAIEHPDTARALAVALCDWADRCEHARDRGGD